MFYAEVVAYKSDPKLENARRIYSTFIESGSPMEVNISYTSGIKVAKHISDIEIKSLEAEKEFTQSRKRTISIANSTPELYHLFDSCAMEIVELMTFDSFKRFIQSEYRLDPVLLARTNIQKSDAPMARLKQRLSPRDVSLSHSKVNLM